MPRCVWVTQRGAKRLEHSGNNEPAGQASNQPSLASITPIVVTGRGGRGAQQREFANKEDVFDVYMLWLV